MKTIVIPTFNNIAVVPIKDAAAKQNEEFNIIVPEESQGPSKKGTILAVGPSASPDLKVGDVVVHHNYSFETVKVGPDQVLIMEDKNVVTKFVEIEEGA